MRLLWLAFILGLADALRRAARAPEGASNATAAATENVTADPTFIVSEIETVVVESAQRRDMGKEFVGKRRERDASTVDFCMVVTNDGPTREFGVLLRSVRKHRGSMAPKFHIVTNPESLEGVRAALKNESLYDADFTMLDEDRIEKKLDELHLKNGFHGGVAAVSKAFMWEFWPEVERCITLDTDTYLVSPLEEFNAVFDSLQERQVTVGVWRPDRAFGDIINTGVLLHHFGHMRRHGWANAVRKSTAMIVMAGAKETTDDGRPVLKWGDQEVVHGALMAYCHEERTTEVPRCGMAVMEHRWNNEMAREFYGSCKKDGGEQVPPGLLHFNSADTSESCYWCRPFFHHYDDCIESYMKEDADDVFPNCPRLWPPWR